MRKRKATDGGEQLEALQGGRAAAAVGGKARAAAAGLGPAEQKRPRAEAPPLPPHALSQPSVAGAPGTSDGHAAAAAPTHDGPAPSHGAGPSQLPPSQLGASSQPAHGGGRSGSRGGCGRGRGGGRGRGRGRGRARQGRASGAQAYEMLAGGMTEEEQMHVLELTGDFMTEEEMLSRAIEASRVEAQAPLLPAAGDAAAAGSAAEAAAPRETGMQP